MDKITRLNYLRTEHAALCDKIAYDKFLLATHNYLEDEKVILKERIQHMEWIARDYLKQAEAVSDAADSKRDGGIPKMQAGD